MDVKKKNNSVPSFKYRSGYYLVGFLVIVASSRFLFNQLQCLMDGRNTTSEPVSDPYLSSSSDKCGHKIDILEKPVDNFAPLVEEIHFGEENCLCNLQGAINGDCSCQIDAVDQFNNYKIYPRLQSILTRNYFRYIQVNLKKDCPFWYDDSTCSFEFCQVKPCGEMYWNDEIPAGLKGQKGLFFRPLSQNVNSEPADCESNEVLGQIDTSLSVESQAGFEKWKLHDDALVDFCGAGDDDGSLDMQYVDLLLNPERYTGYQGPSAHRVWSSVYNENCFRETDNVINLFGGSQTEAACIEKRTFYRAISGLHSSINIHLSAKYLLSDTKSGSLFKSKGELQWGPNVTEFRNHFENDQVKGQSSQWLKNLYFLYLLELRAISKISGYLRQYDLYTGNRDEDVDVKSAIGNFLRVVDSFPFHFDEKALFAGTDAAKLKVEFHNRFTNITKIMDCVGCQKCRLWGKTQIKGLGTALKILFADSFVHKRGSFLTRDEIVALFNGFGRLSESIYQLDNFRRMISEEENSHQQPVKPVKKFPFGGLK